MCVPFSLQATIGRILRRITFVAPASGGKCICIESTGAPLGFIENNCGNHSWKKEIGVFYQKSSWRLRCCKKQYKDEKNSNIFSENFITLTMLTCDHLLLLLLSPPWLENHVLDLSLSLLDIVSHLLCITISVLAVQAVLFIYIAISSCAALVLVF